MNITTTSGHARRDPYSTPSIPSYAYTDIRIERLREEVVYETGQIKSIVQTLFQQTSDLYRTVQTPSHPSIEDFDKLTLELANAKEEIQYLRKEVQTLKKSLHTATESKNREITQLQQTVQKIETLLSSQQENAKRENIRLADQIASLESHLDAQILDLKKEIEQGKQKLQAFQAHVRSSHNTNDIVKQIGSLAHRLDVLFEDLEEQKEQIRQEKSERTLALLEMKEDLRNSWIVNREKPILASAVKEAPATISIHSTEEKKSKKTQGAEPSSHPILSAAKEEKATTAAQKPRPSQISKMSEEEFESAIDAFVKSAPTREKTLSKNQKMAANVSFARVQNELIDCLSNPASPFFLLESSFDTMQITEKKPEEVLLEFRRNCSSSDPLVINSYLNNLRQNGTFLVLVNRNTQKAFSIIK